VAAPLPTPGADQPAAEVILRVAEELRDMRALSVRLEGVIADLLPTASGGDAALHRDLQLLDILDQSLEDLARFLSGAALQMPEQWRLDPDPAAATLAQRVLADRLAAAREIRPADPVAANGDCAFF